MKQLIIVIVILIAGMALASDPNSMPTPTAQNRVTSCVHGDITYLQVYTPEANQKFISSHIRFPALIEEVIFRHFTQWIKELFIDFNADLTESLITAQEAREARDLERTR